MAPRSRAGRAPTTPYRPAGRDRCRRRDLAPHRRIAAHGRALSLRDGLVYSKNTITAQLVQTIGADRVAQLARAMGVRDSKLEEVPSLALGTSPVTLKEWSAPTAPSPTAGYLAPSMVTRIEDRTARCWRSSAAVAERALSATANDTLLDVMRDVIDRGTGTAIRTRFGIRADVAGKTGTTQDNTDGWFILMHPQLVAGAWVGFNDSRVTLRSDYWGQGAHSALPIVGDFYQRACARGSSTRACASRNPTRRPGTPRLPIRSRAGTRSCSAPARRKRPRPFRVRRRAARHCRRPITTPCHRPAHRRRRRRHGTRPR
jgi:membrane peptidoglycan carboxypeptidase